MSTFTFSVAVIAGRRIVGSRKLEVVAALLSEAVEYVLSLGITLTSDWVSVSDRGFVRLD